MSENTVSAPVLELGEKSLKTTGKIPQGTLLALIDAEDRGDNSRVATLAARFFRKVIVEEDLNDFYEALDDADEQGFIDILLTYVAEVSGNPKVSSE